MIRYLFALIIFGLAACSPTPGSPPTYKERSIQNAVADARASMRIFFEAWQSENPDYSDFRVTVIMPSSAYGRDYEQLSNIRREFAGFIGETSAGKDVPFLVADIADWQFQDGEKIRGAFIRRTQFDMVDAEIPSLRELYHEDPLP
ncbi:MAG: hypothetical protein AAGB16_03260 [Pseudomonadota bacterium]